MIELTERTQKALAAPMAALLPAEVRALILDLARANDSARWDIAKLFDRITHLERLQDERQGTRGRAAPRS